MSDLAKLQQQFMDLLQGENSDITEQIAQQGQLSTQQRLSIYQNAYKIRLRAVIEQDHQQLGIYLGDDLFEQMVDGYLALYPSSHTSLRIFADKLPDYLATQTPFKNYPILADIAKFERLLLSAFDASDAALLAVESLEMVEPLAWPTLILNLHPSAQLVKFSTSAVESWQAIKEKQTPPDPQLSALRFWVIARDADRRTQYVSVDEQEYRLLNLLKQKTPFAQLCQSCLNELPGDKIAEFLIIKVNQWLERGWLISG
ncbi:putative DNA-binding domain-containing protein [Pseudoalteromonas sp. SG45-5]|uniref:Putative DNA-binding domain-containing protein n=1 Tax=Pseudoalteromonas aliena SW19 TaxID=1314866 RepID=A0ABR9DXB0_9GAMM|nr:MULTISPECIES: DNA-binding domain-containing protein [Pseudoalteromonas]MBB1386283.1 putative DNA-binding domain-containing protein [Pseudoalteromonas sp. SG45-5]MBB1394346.1 putative DNA-binding domain-containing protein [Pseudoalteromonas sp. SG44-4]MBB1447660.1 putative DNA-binding domain-containing protein [Pseudoalteromonas sp. SG41-6]MBE0358986.1 hypothetical protein [Pseudoalteromonas aliena SW19]